MRSILLWAISILPLSASIQALVPGSTSPDGKVALFYRHHRSASINEGYEFYFCDVQSEATLGENLAAPTSDAIMTAALAKADGVDSGMLFDGIGVNLEAKRTGVISDPAFSYFVAWSPDSKWVSIEGGAHKFWRVTIYHLVDGEFQNIPLDGVPFGAFFQKHLSLLDIKPMGAFAAIRKISTRNYDYPNVCWLGNGMAAINTWSYLLRDPQYQKLLSGSDPQHPNLDHAKFFFLLDARTKPPTVVDFCE